MVHLRQILQDINDQGIFDTKWASTNKFLIKKYLMLSVHKNWLIKGGKWNWMIKYLRKWDWSKIRRTECSLNAPNIPPVKSAVTSSYSVKNMAWQSPYHSETQLLSRKGKKGIRYYLKLSKKIRSWQTILFKKIKVFRFYAIIHFRIPKTFKCNM